MSSPDVVNIVGLNLSHYVIIENYPSIQNSDLAVA
jgi:hypothetical protein